VRAGIGAPRAAPARPETGRKGPSPAPYQPGWERPTASLLPAQIFEFNVLERYFHRVAGVQLPGDDAFVRHPGEVAIDRDPAVQSDGHVLADARDGIRIEVILLQGPGNHLLRSRPHHAPELFPVQAAPVSFPDVALWPLDGKLAGVEDLAADLDATV